MATHRPVILYLLGTLCMLLHQADSNEAPRFVNFPSPLTANEDISLDTTIGVLEAVDIDNENLEFAIQGEIANLILRLERVGPKKVEIRLKKKLDREMVSQYSMIFQVSDSINTIQKPAILFVIDVNDNEPSFTNLPYRVDVPEDSLVGMTVFKVTALDPDSSIWGLISYNIIMQQGVFEVNAYSGAVTLKEPLNYEAQAFYQLEITAVDGDGLNSSTDLIINVIDVQDTPPYFIHRPYLASVPENATVGASVVQVTAEDGDRGVPNAVNYTFLSDQNYFHIDQETGMITVSAPLDREDAQMESLLGVITLTVMTQEVTSAPQGKTTATAVVTIRILDVNDETPMFNHRVYEATVLENAQAHIPVTLLPHGVEMIISDHDKGDNGRLEVWLVGCDTFEVVPSRVLNEATLIVRVKNSSALDYEVVQNITFQIVAQEYLTEERHSATAEVIVHIKDVNDNWPRFEKDHYVASIPENSARGTFVTHVTASDEDSGIFAHLTYKILGASSHLFSINSSTGDVSVAVDADQDWTILDREKLDTHQVTVEAVDGGGKRSSVRLDIHLVDVNDQSPEIVRSQYESYVRENEASLERAVVVEATDRDLPPNNEITYSITSGDTNANFTINSTTGHMSLAGPIDYEAMAPELAGKFTLVVMAKDHGIPPLSSTATVVVYVQDMNDRRPYFERETYTAVITENCTGGSYVTTVSASDNDITAPNNEVIYRIQSGSRDKFRIDAQSGKILVELGADLDRDVYGSHYTLVVLARDHGTPQLSGSATVHVTIMDVNNKVPIFSHDHRTVHLLESAAIWREVATYTATDLDENSHLQYSLVEGLVEGVDEGQGAFENHDYLKSLFGIHRANGTVYVKARLDRETVEEVTVTILVEDVNAQLPLQQNATAKLTIVLDDVNDNSPVFSPSAMYTAQISEASQPGLNVKQLLATDADKDSTPIKYYIIHNSEQSNVFKITDTNRESGVITLNKTVDHERDHWINFTVLAVDSGTPSLSATANVAVEIKDINDNSPEWRTLESAVDVWENVTVGTEVATVGAVDRDSGEFSKVMYFIKDGAFGKFQINNKTGTITTLAPLDREDIELYSLTVEARDNPGAPLSEQRKTPGYIRVRLLDVNDNRPAFEQTFYTGTDITENTKVGSQIVTVEANDADITDNGVVVYSVDPTAGNSSDLFGVRTGADSGRVYVSAPLHGKVGVYYVVIVARDRGDPSLWSTATVAVHVADVNDHVPAIVRPPQNQTVYILENVPEGFFVTQVTAVDDDKGTNGEVRYELVRNPSNQIAWQKFRIDATSGNITTTGAIDRETLETYYLDVRAYDLGTPSYDDRRTLTIVVVDTDDNPPNFDRKVVPSPYRITVLEEDSGVDIATVALAMDLDLGNNSHICYYIVGGDREHWDRFLLDKVSGRLRLVRPLDREVTTHVDLVVRASEDCWTDPLLRPENRDVAWDILDTSLLWVQVDVKDINDNAPKLAKRWFTAGVSEDTQVGATVLNLADYTEDPDEGNNSVNLYYIQPPFRITQPLETQLRQRGENDVFRIGRQDGIIRTNIYFQADMQGYFEFVVIVNDSVKGHQDSTNVSRPSSGTSEFLMKAAESGRNSDVYLLSGSQRVRVILRGNTQEVGGFKDHFADFLSNITHMIINIDSIQTHQDTHGKPDSRKTDMFLHAVDPKTGKVLDSGTLIDLIDKNYIHLVHLFKTYNVIEIVRSVPVAAATTSQASLQIALILVAVFLGCLLIIVCITCFMLRNRYKRQLKAATAMAFANHNNTGPGSREVGLDRLDMPGTNLHSHEGSNPVWLGQYEPSWPHQSDKDSGTSVDNNAVMASHYDEQEMSVEMYNDEYDNYNRVPALTMTTTTPTMSRNRAMPNVFPKHAPPLPMTSNHNGLPRKLRRKPVNNKVNCNSHGVETKTIPNGRSGENGVCFDYHGNDNHAYLPAETFKKMDGIEMESTEI